jgi:hypothetical protein
MAAVGFEVERRGGLPFAKVQLGTKREEVPLPKQGGKDRPIRVLEGDNEGGGAIGGEEGGSTDPRGELGDAKAPIERVVDEKGLVARFSGVSWENLGNSMRHTVNEQLAPLDVGTGGEGSGSRQGSLDGANNEVVGSLKLCQGCLGTGEHDQVAQGRPLCSGYPDVGMAWFGDECLIARGD